MLQAPSGAGIVPDHLPGELTFKFTGRHQTWRAPKNVRGVTVVAFGAAGDGLGGRATAVLPVRPGEQLTIVVGGNGYKSQGGGGRGGNYSSSGEFGFGGGDSTDIREHGNRLSDRIFVVGGGGGAGGGGGGGSSYAEATALKHRTWSGWKEATHGLLVLKW
jgi:hypothetical protein